MSTRKTLHAVRFIGINPQSETVGELPDLLVPAKRWASASSNYLHEVATLGMQVVRLRKREPLPEGWQCISTQREFAEYVESIATLEKLHVDAIPTLFNHARRVLASAEIPTLAQPRVVHIRSKAGSDQVRVGAFWYNSAWFVMGDKLFKEPSSSNEHIMVGRARLYNHTLQKTQDYVPFHIRYTGGLVTPTVDTNLRVVQSIESPHAFLDALNNSLNTELVPFNLSVQLETTDACGLDLRLTTLEQWCNE